MNNTPYLPPISKKTNGTHSTFARLMSTENIQVLFGGQDMDAWFDTENRVLHIPEWTSMTPEVYDLLISHEVSHAIHTPKNEWLALPAELCKNNGNAKDAKIAQGYMNVIEDARIERLIKSKYPGLARDYRAGYEWIRDHNGFGKLPSDLSKLSFIDRINLHFKCAIHTDTTVPFTEKEWVMVERIASTKTFADVAQCTRDVWNHDLGEKDADQPLNGEGMDDGDSKSIGNSRLREPITVTAQNKYLARNRASYASKDVPVELCQYDLNKIIVPSKYIIDTIKHDEIESAKSPIESERFLLLSAKDAYMAFTREAQPTIDAMVKVFMLKKAAAKHHRTQQRKTGLLDMRLLSEYKWNEDLFRSFTIEPNGKNHGFVVLLDWSGSMQALIRDVVKQMYILTSFFRRIGVPYEVFAFSSSTPPDSIRKEFMPRSKENEALLHCPLMLMQFATSTHTKLQHREAMEKLWNLCGGLCYDCGSLRPADWLRLGDTPLDSAIIAVTQFIPQFRKKNNIEIMNCVVITDGQTTDSPLGNGRGVYGATRLVNPRTGASYDLHHNCTTNVAAQYLHDHTGCNTIMMFLSHCRRAGVLSIHGASVITHDKNDEDISRNWIRERYLLARPFNGIGFKEIYAMNVGTQGDGEESFEEMNMTNTAYSKLKNQFVKSLKSRIVSRGLVNRLVAGMAKHT